MKVTLGIIKNYDSHVLARKLGYHDQFRYNTFQINNGDGHFSNYGFYTGTTNTDWSWAPLSEDFDHNGHQDLFITNGYLKDIIHLDYIKYQMDSLRKISNDNKAFGKAWTSFVKPFKLTNYFYANNGKMQFDKVSDIWADGRSSFSNGSAYGDLDNDGDLDLVVNNFNEPAFLMKNTISEKKESYFVSIQLEGNKGNRHGVGAELIIRFDDGSVQRKIFQPGRGFYSSMDYRLAFGFPKEKKIASIDVFWPDRTAETYASVQANKIVLRKGKGSKTIPDAKIPAYFAESTFPFVHVENEYVDFKREPLLHLKNSTDGPCIATADVNGDRKSDIYMGGAHGQAGALFLEKPENQWQKLAVADFESDKTYEDTGAAFADFDADGDQDLLVASGGYQWPQGDNHYAVRLYRNDGKGGFKRDLKAVPNIFTNASCVVIGDWDGDKDVDVFIGGGAVPGSYPVGDKSYYLQNDKGTLSDQSKLIPEELKGTMVKAGLSDDMDGDKKPDLVTAGDYQPIRIFSFERSFAIKHAIHKSDGLWQSLLAVDLEGDGIKEIIGGNLGENSFMVANEENPACIYSGDFDDNGEMDAIHCINREGKNYPIHSMDEIQAHMTSLRKKYLRYRQYANKTPEDIFGDKIKKAKLFYVYNFSSTLYKKSGNEYSKHTLPLAAQLSMVKCLGTVKVDGQTYLAGAGNFYDTDYDYGKYDASKGFMVKLDATLSFSPMENSGFNANGNVRSMAVVSNQQILVCGNNERCKFFAAKQEWQTAANHKPTVPKQNK
ncbi:MAG: VCBS repeat-containing protein [Saprospiraceae bacterium]|nr:VCBS repeat-containing protein [Saprospiraceae bacterium]